MVATTIPECSTPAESIALVESLAGAIDALASAEVVGVPLGDELVGLARERARLDAEIARRVRAFDRSKEWAAAGSRSAAAFLRSQTRGTADDCGRQVHVARQIGALDATAAAWAEGAINTRHVEVIAGARHAARDDDAFAEFEPALVEVARVGTPSDVAALARQWRDALDAALDRDGADRDDIAGKQHERRGFDFARSIQGMGFGRVTLDPLGAETLETALRIAYEAGHRAGDPRTPSQQRADALVEIARTYLEDRPEVRRTNLPNVLMIVDEATVEGDSVGECRLSSGARIAPATARRLLCDSIVQPVIIDENGVPLAMGRAVRTFTPDQFRAMVVRDAHCRGPGCAEEPSRCEAHHLRPWSREGPTDLDNGLLVCRGNCHRMLHEGGWTVTGSPNGQLDFYDRDGNHLGSSQPHAPVAPIPTKQGRNRNDLATLARERAYELRAA